ncbi:hypothetical protein HELRODRAFT_146759, partial [Helobdella robusta]|uniref:YEATS domain-containing protein n=1 Tax=Helobdella robusta TaxID=6412 RepID=T1EJU2_HELRO
ISVCYKEPYKVVESGNIGFTLPIDIHLKNEGHPKVVRFVYTMFWGVTEWVEYERCEGITFENPSLNFYEKLLQAATV